jgi:hypothetical protein
VDIDGLCEQILLSSGQVDEAYARYALTANQAGTYLAWFRTVAKKYPHKSPAAILSDLVRHTPGDEGKWFAAAKEAKLFDEAITLANRTPCDPRTLTRAARDFAEQNPAFATEAGLSALYGDSEAFRFFLEALRAAQYSFMRADTACRLASVSRFRARLGAEGFGFAGLVNFVCLDDASGPAAAAGFVASVPAAARFRGVAGAISMPNISERSSRASTFALAGPSRGFERSDPALAIKSC